MKMLFQALVGLFLAMFVIDGYAQPKLSELDFKKPDYWREVSASTDEDMELTIDGLLFGKQRLRLQKGLHIAQGVVTTGGRAYFMIRVQNFSNNRWASDERSRGLSTVFISRYFLLVDGQGIPSSVIEAFKRDPGDGGYRLVSFL
jgi:hypothetical protein